MTLISWRLCRQTSMTVRDAGCMTANRHVSIARPRSMGAADLAELRALQDLASLSLRGCPSLAAAGVSSLAALTALRRASAGIGEQLAGELAAPQQQGCISSRL